MPPTRTIERRRRRSSGRLFVAADSPAMDALIAALARFERAREHPEEDENSLPGDVDQPGNHDASDGPDSGGPETPDQSEPAGADSSDPEMGGTGPDNELAATDSTSLAGPIICGGFNLSMYLAPAPVLGGRVDVCA